MGKIIFDGLSNPSKNPFFWNNDEDGENAFRKWQDFLEDKNNKWNAWYEKNKLKFENLPLPKSVFDDRDHFIDFVFDLGDKYYFADFNIDDLSDEEGLKLLVILDKYIEESDKGLSVLYRSLRDRFSFFYGFDEMPSLPSWVLEKYS